MITTKMSRAIMPSMLNGHHALFGGEVLSWLDEISGITAARYAQAKVVTVAIEQVLFKKPIQLGEYIDVEGEVLSVGNTSLRVMTKVWIDRKKGEREEAVEAIFVYVALDEEGNPRKIMEES